MKPHLVILAGVVWAVGAVASYVYMFAYNSEPAEVGVAARTWPVGSTLKRSPGAFELVMGVHPHCPCTRASVAELNKLMQGLDGKVEVHAVVFKASEFSSRWDQTDITSRLAELPHSHVHRDVDGVEARVFGLSTSGQVLLYAPDGKLMFNGGLTSFRGHEGPSLGQTALEHILNGRDTTITTSKVFGCSLSDDGCTRTGSGGAQNCASDHGGKDE